MELVCAQGDWHAKAGLGLLRSFQIKWEPCWFLYLISNLLKCSHQKSGWPVWYCIQSHCSQWCASHKIAARVGVHKLLFIQCMLLSNMEAGCEVHLLNSSRGLACECVDGEDEAGSCFRLLEKACRCLTSRRTTKTCSSVGLKGS